MENKKIIILDFDGTLYSGDAAFSKLPRFIAKHKRNFFPNLTDYQYRKITKNNLEWKNTWTGSDIVRFIYESKNKYPQYPISIRDYLKWENSYIEPLMLHLEDVKFIDRNFLQNLCNNYAVYIVSNSSINHIKYFMDQMNINPDWFKKIISNKFIAKDITKKHYYQYILDTECCTPKQIYVFGDSMRSDIIPAQELGMNACLVDDAETLPKVIMHLINQ